MLWKSPFGWLGGSQGITRRTIIYTIGDLINWQLLTAGWSKVYVTIEGTHYRIVVNKDDKSHGNNNNIDKATSPPVTVWSDKCRLSCKTFFFNFSLINLIFAHVSKSAVIYREPLAKVNLRQICRPSYQNHWIQSQRADISQLYCWFRTQPTRSDSDHLVQIRQGVPLLNLWASTQRFDKRGGRTRCL